MELQRKVDELQGAAPRLRRGGSDGNLLGSNGSMLDDTLLHSQRARKTAPGSLNDALLHESRDHLEKDAPGLGPHGLGARDSEAVT